MRGIMNASLLQTDSLSEQVQSLLTAVDRLRSEVDELRQENGELHQQVRELRCDVSYWKSMHARATQRNVKLQAELDHMNRWYISSNDMCSPNPASISPKTRSTIGSLSTTTPSQSKMIRSNLVITSFNKPGEI